MIYHPVGDQTPPPPPPAHKHTHSPKQSLGTSDNKLDAILVTNISQLSLLLKDDCVKTTT